MAAPEIRVLEPEFNPVPSKMTYTQGDTAKLLCSVSQLGERTIVWRKLPNPNPLTIGVDTWVEDSRLHVEHVHKQNQWNLIIEHVTTEDEGDYECQVSMKEKSLRQVIQLEVRAMWTLFLLHLVSFLWYQPAPCLQQLYPSFFSPALSHPLHYSSPPPPAPVPSVYPLRHYPPPLPSPPSSNLPMRYSRDQLLEIQPSTPNFELVNRLRELRLGVGLPRKRGCRGGRKKLRSIQVVPSRNLHPLMVPPFLQPHPDLQSAVGNAPLSSKHPTHLPTTDCLLSITPLMGGQPSDAPALSPPSPLQQGGQSSNAPALSPPSPLPQGSQPIALVLSPSSPLPQDGQPSDAPGLSPSSSTLLLCPSDSTLSICHLNSQSAVKTDVPVKRNPDILIRGNEFVSRGGMIALLCNVTSLSDNNQNLQWVKDGNILTWKGYGGRISIVTRRSRDSPAMSSLLRVRDVTVDDAGKYTCRSSDLTHVKTLSVAVTTGGASNNVKRAGSMMLENRAVGCLPPDLAHLVLVVIMVLSHYLIT
ncbi:hypothetical protein ACOMHN_062548 [Nucella lapillus]